MAFSKITPLLGALRRARDARKMMTVKKIFPGQSRCNQKKSEHSSFATERTFIDSFEVCSIPLLSPILLFAPNLFGIALLQSARWLK